MNSRPLALPATVRAATTSQAATSSANRATDATRSTSAPLRTARAMVPVTQVPTGNVKLHHVRAKGSSPRAGRPATRVPPAVELSSTTAIKAAARGARSTLTAARGPVSSLAVAAELSSGTLRAVPVTGVDLTRTLWAVWTAGRRLTGPARDLYAIAARRAAVASASVPT